MKETRQLTQTEMAQEVADLYNEMDMETVNWRTLAAAIEGCSMQLRRYRKIEQDLPDISSYDENALDTGISMNRHSES